MEVLINELQKNTVVFIINAFKSISKASWYAALKSFFLDSPISDLKTT